MVKSPRDHGSCVALHVSSAPTSALCGDATPRHHGQPPAEVKTSVALAVGDDIVSESASPHSFGVLAVEMMVVKSMQDLAIVGSNGSATISVRDMAFPGHW